jgi:long-chain acyl-CoA synthetase
MTHPADADDPGTLGAMWRAAIAEPRPFPAFLVRERAAWRPVGWDAAGERVERVAAGLLESGVGRGQRVALVVPTRMEWTVCDFALHAIGAIPVPLYTTVSAADAGHVLADSGARLALVAPSEYRALRDTLEGAGVEPVLVGEPADGLRTLDGLAEAGAAALRRAPDAVRAAGAPVSADDVASIVYTSGTTGPPKGCVLTHGNLRAMTELVAGIPGLLREGETVLLFLPLAHSFARLMQNLAVRVGITIAYCPDLRSLPSALPSVRPHILPSVPRAYELLHRQIQGQLAEQRGTARAVAAWAVGVGRRTEHGRVRGRGGPPWLAAEHALADRLVFARLRRRMGGRLRLAIAGGAPLPESVGEFLAAVGLPVYEGYGMTEATTASHFNLPGHHRFGTVGRVLPRIDARIAADGEVQLRGPTVFQGYHGDPESTRAAFTLDGWLHTGDLGSEDADGYLRITGRRKDLIVTSGGENVAPSRIEQALTADPLISQALVLGDRRPYLVALLTLDPGEQHRRRLDRPAAEAAVAAAVRRVNATLGDAEQIRRHAVLNQEFSADRGEVTPTLKLRREQCQAHNAEVVAGLYAARGSRPPG